MKLVPLGVGNAFSANSYASSLFITHDGFGMLIDCPHPIRKMMMEAGQCASMPIDLDRVDALVLTHLHGDHCSGLESAAFYNHYALKKKIHLVGHPEVIDPLWPHHLAHTLAPLCDPAPKQRQFGDYFEVTALNETASIAIGPFQIQCKRTSHHIPTFALRIAADGKTVSFSADTGYYRALIDWLSASDLIIHETGDGSHTPFEKLAALPQRIKQKMRLIHYPDDFVSNDPLLIPLSQGERIIL